MPTEIIIHATLLAVMCAIVAFTYSEILTEAGMIFNWLYKIIDRLPEMVSKPIITCFRCVSGQLALWAFLLFFGHNYRTICTYYHGVEALILTAKTVFIHAYTITLTIYTTWIINKIYRLAS